MDIEAYNIFIKDQDVTQDVLLIEPAGQQMNVMFKNGRSYSYSRKNVVLIPKNKQEIDAKTNFSYLQSIAEAVGLKNDLGQNILLKNLNRVSATNKDSVLYDFLSGVATENEDSITDEPICPFGFNLSQKEAVDNALSSRVSIIQDPPGTGKTQTILNIIANIVIADKTVAVVSANNSATANVLEKLQKYQLDFLAAFLGNTTNIAAFNAQEHKIPDMSEWQKDSRWSKRTNKKIIDLHQSLLTMLEEQNRLAKHKIEIDTLNTEYRHFLQEHSNPDTESVSHLSADQVMTLWLRCERYLLKNRKPNFIERLLMYFKYKVKDKRLLINKPEEIITICQAHWYQQKLQQLTQDITKSEQKLAKFNFANKIETYTNLSMQLLKSKLADKYKNTNREQNTSLNKDFLKSYPVILSTTYSLTNCLFDGLYDYVIIDESSQVDLVTGALALGCATHAVIVGDLKQLPNVVDEQSANTTDDIFNNFNINEVYRYKNHSILSAVSELFPDVPSVMLREHYRCHPKIIEFCNQRFYKGQLIILSNNKSAREPLVVYKTKPGNHARNHVNNRQIDVIIDEVIPQQKLDVNTGSIGIVTPYRNQVAALQKVFNDTEIQADTVDKFQGREKDIIILSMVDNDISEFADQPNRLNVAISRAINQLIVVTNGNEDQNDTNIKALIDYINYNNLTVVNSDIGSIFDCLYKCYESKRRQMIKSKVSEFDSENLMYDLVKSVLSEERFNIFDVVLHVPLKNIFKNLSKLSDKEYEYANNMLTHCDFIIFDRVTKRPVLGIEVDGTKYHQENTKQSERDKMKDNIFATYNMPLIRFRTDGSQERNKLIKVLSKSLNNN